jgi:hypothetical protein
MQGKSRFAAFAPSWETPVVGTFEAARAAILDALDIAFEGAASPGLKIATVAATQYFEALEEDFQGPVAERMVMRRSYRIERW